MSQHFFTGIDVGSSKLRALVGEKNSEGKMTLLGSFEVRSSGLRKGRVSDFNEIVQSMGQLLAQVRGICKPALRDIILGLPGVDFKMHRSRGSVAVARADSEISENDIGRVLEAARAVHVPNNRMLVHTVTREFIVDGVHDIVDPLGMMGGKLEVDSLIMDLFAPSVKSLTKSIEMGGGQVESLIFEPLAISRSILSKNQKDLGVMSLDIGFGITNLSVFEDGKLLHVAAFPVGAGNITNDLAIGIKSSVDVAEKMKLAFGHALSREIPNRAQVDLAKIDPFSKGQVSRRFIIDIIEARLAEILDFVNNELKSIGRMGSLPAGVILSGGGSKMPGLVELIKRELRLPAQIGIPDLSLFEINDPALNEKLADPEFAALVGLVLWKNDIVDGVSKASYHPKEWWRRLLGLFVP